MVRLWGRKGEEMYFEPVVREGELDMSLLDE